MHAEDRTDASSISTLLARVYFLALVCMSFTPRLAAQQGVMDVTPCELAANPEKFDGKFIRIRGHIQIGFEQFALDTGSCEKPHDDIWLEYGEGPKEQPTIWCCGDMKPRNGVRIRRNEDFRKFHKYLTARILKFMGGDCYDCYLYDVTATITGRVDCHKEKAVKDPSRQYALCLGFGFGHFGAYCTRLVIQSVEDIEAKDVSDKFRSP